MNVLKKTKVFKRGLVLMGLTAFIFTSCEKEETEGPVVEKEPVELGCNYFNEDRVLENDPERPVDYIISCNMVIRGSKVEVEPGTVIDFTEKGGIELYNDSEGYLIAKGTAEEPIVFKGTNSQKGHWRGIQISNDNSNNELSYVKIQDAGRDNRPALRVNLNAHLILKNSEIFNNSNTGLSVFTATPFGGVDDGAYAVVIENNKVYDNKRPVAVHLQNVGNISSSNDFSGNEVDEIFVETGNSSGYQITQDVTWQAHEQPYILEGGGVHLFAKLTIEPGAVLKFDLDQKLELHPPSGGRGTGEIYAVGTAEKSIIFTSIEDIPKYWAGIIVNSDHPSNEIGHATIENTGNEDTGSRWEQGNVVLSNASHKLNIHDVTFKSMNTRFCAVRGPATTSNIAISGPEGVEGGGCAHNPDHRRGNNDYDM